MYQRRSATRLGYLDLCIGVAGFLLVHGSEAVAKCSDAAAQATLRADVEAQCPCAGASDRGSYVRCTKTAIEQAVAQNQLLSSCASDVKKCISRSTCGRAPGWVTCCRTTKSGRTKCSVKPSAAKCKAPAGGGSSCSTGFASCCDACTASGCAAPYTPTPAMTATSTMTPTPAATATSTVTPPPLLTPTSSTTQTATMTETPTITLTPTATPTIPPICQSVLGLPTIAQVPFKITQGSTQCGGASLSNPPPAAPFSGSVADGSNATIGDLSLGCLYAGVFPGLVVPEGAVSMLSVVGVNLLPPSVTLGGSAGHGSSDCTLGAGPGSACVDGSPGSDGTGQCATDNDCSGAPGSCQPQANCFFGPPIPVANGAASACVVNAFLTDLCGSVGLLPPQANLATVLSSRVYFSGHPSEPCPRCVGGFCDGGDHMGQACTAVGSAQTSVDCPPTTTHFFGALTVVLPSLTTGTSTLPSSGGIFCPDQDAPGAFGLSAAQSISEVGVPPGGSTNALAMNLAATFCVPATGTPIDFFAQLPAAGALSAAGELDLSSVLP